tara:strand:- start:4092 stop:4805 length:714 start_codon:yes stop_codon:yes gene_type:complete
MNDFTFAHREEGFDNHIDKSIRGYKELLNDVVSFSRYFVEEKTHVLDIGCSTGKLTKEIFLENHEHKNRVTYEGVEYAKGFQEDLHKRSDELWKMVEESKNRSFINFSEKDIREYSLGYNKYSYITSIFTLQFMPKTDREKLIRDIYTSLIPGGAFVFAEKVYSQNAHIQDMLTFMYYDYKRKHFEDKDILDKENTLRHMLKPNTWPEINEFLTKAGFKDIQVFWRNHNFLGAIVIK